MDKGAKRQRTPVVATCVVCAAQIDLSTRLARCSCGHMMHAQCADMVHHCCPYCGALLVVTATDIKIQVSGANADEVHRVSAGLLTKSRELPVRTMPNNPWLSGSFYLFAVVLLIIVALTAARIVTVFMLPIVLIFGIVALSVVGAMQLRHDGNLSEKSFLSLMLASLKSLPLLKRKG